MNVTLIAAMDENALIGADGGMPWHLPGDLQWFKRNTLGKPMLMGRGTFEAIGRALPRRTNLVLSRNPAFAAEGAARVASLDEAIARAADEGAHELMVIGGGQVYAAVLSRATRLLITRIQATYSGDTWFPEIDWRDWRLQSDDVHAATEDAPAYRFMVYERRNT